MVILNSESFATQKIQRCFLLETFFPSTTDSCWILDFIDWIPHPLLYFVKKLRYMECFDLLDTFKSLGGRGGGKMMKYPGDDRCLHDTC